MFHFHILVRILCGAKFTSRPSPFTTMEAQPSDVFFQMFNLSQLRQTIVSMVQIRSRKKPPIFESRAAVGEATVTPPQSH